MIRIIISGKLIAVSFIIIAGVVIGPIAAIVTALYFMEILLN